MREINDWIATRRLDAIPNVAFVDTRRGRSRAPGNADRLVELTRRLHPSVRGYRRMADAIRRRTRDASLR